MSLEATILSLLLSSCDSNRDLPNANSFGIIFFLFCCHLFHARKKRTPIKVLQCQWIYVHQSKRDANQYPEGPTDTEFHFHYTIILRIDDRIEYQKMIQLSIAPSVVLLHTTRVIVYAEWYKVGIVAHTFR